MGGFFFCIYPLEVVLLKPTQSNINNYYYADAFVLLVHAISGTRRDINSNSSMTGCLAITKKEYLYMACLELN